MDLKEKIRVIEGFPTPDISFKDVTTLTKDGEAYRYAIDELCKLVPEGTDLIVGPESRGFLFGAPMAVQLGIGFEPVRKPGKLPGETVEYSYTLEYGTDTLQLHKDAIKPGDKVVIVDDLIATGGTLEACCKLVEELGGEVAAIIALIELTDIKGREVLSKYDLRAIVEYPF